MNRRLNFGLLVSTCVLGGCMSMSGLDASASYACKAPDGVKCDSVSGTYHNAISNNLPGQRKAPAGLMTPPAASATEEARHESGPLTVLAAAKTPAAGSSFPTMQPQSLRSGPRILRMWIKPWEDSDRDLNGESVVFVQVESGRWLVENAQRQARNPYAPRASTPAAVSRVSPESITRAQTSLSLSGQADGEPKTSNLPAILRNLPQTPQPPSASLPSASD